jgi:c-di-GMP-binding flagellar brake protein YcgR
MVQGIRESGESEEHGTQTFLSKLYDYLNKMELEASSAGSAISSTRQLNEGQSVRILIPGVGVYNSEVIKSGGNFLTVSRPTNTKLSSVPHWDGLGVSIYFWRDDDAGYVFDTEVVDEVYSRGISSLKVAHCDSLFRTQKRKSQRLKLNKPAFLYLADENDIPGDIEKRPGLKCVLEDVSDTGCAVRVGGQASLGMKVKVQFALNNVPICILGDVRAVDFREDINNSLMRIQAEPLPLSMKNHILGEIFGMQPDDDDDELPVRVNEKEAVKNSTRVISEAAAINDFMEELDG